MRSHFSRIPQAEANKLIYRLYQKVSYASKIVDLVINGFSFHEARSHLHIYDYSIVNFGIRGLCLRFSNTFHVDILYRFRKSVIDKFKTDICIF